jgi:hypothetical protein
VRRRTRMGQRPPVAAGPSPSWKRVILDTITLWWARRRQYHLQRDKHQRRFRLRVLVLGGLVIVGAGLLVYAISESANLSPDAASIPAPPSSSQQNEELAGSARRSAPESSRAIPSWTASVARAAAGAEIAARADIDVSPSAATVLREGTVDGRLLVVLASLATADLLTSVDTASSGSGGPVGVANLELGVVDVDRVLDWLDGQRRLRADRMEVRRDGSVTYLQLRYDTQEPPGLFPS